MNPDRSAYSKLIKEKAISLGFSACGIAKVRSLEEERNSLAAWLSKGMNGSMAYMERNRDMRVDPSKIVEGAKSIISVLINYYSPESPQDPQAPVISRYAYGKDYHFIVKEKLKQLLEFIRQEISSCEGRPFVDSAPVMERAWAKEAGLGWIGKHSLLISREHGSYVFIGELIIDLELGYDHEIVPDYCGSCTRCMEACPTKAIVAPHQIDARKCISYLTIEDHKEIPSEFQGKIQNRLFGCDICQDACPWNKKIIPTAIKEFKPAEGLLQMTKTDWITLDQSAYNNKFKGTALQRAGFKKLKSNIIFLNPEEQKDLL